MSDREDLRRSWDIFATNDPLWAICSNDGFKDNRWDKDAFYATGDQYISALMPTIELRYFVRALDFGCGVGRLTFPLSWWFKKVDGFDISGEMTGKAHAESKRSRTPNSCTFCSSTSEHLLYESQTFDFIISYLVLQHMKTELAVGYIKELIRVLNEKGVLYFQCPVRFTTEDGKDGETEFEFARSKATMEMNCHPREVIERAIEDGGGRIIKVDQDWSCGPVIESACYSVVRKTAKYTLGGVANCR